VPRSRRWGYQRRTFAAEGDPTGTVPQQSIAEVLTAKFITDGNVATTPFRYV
jgi:hypothetical protein